MLRSSEDGLFHPGTHRSGSNLFHAATGGDRPITRNSLQTFCAQNRGLLIIALSQLFFSMMYMGVKLLTMLDTPVPTFEVRLHKTPSVSLDQVYFRS